MSTLLDRALDANVASMLMNDAARDPQSKTSSMDPFCCEKRIEDAASDIRINTCARVGHRNAHTFLSRLPPGDVTSP